MTTKPPRFGYEELRLTAEQQQELAQGEIHDLRNAMTSVTNAAELMKKGLWDVPRFVAWWKAKCEERDQILMSRFQNILRRDA